MLEGYRDININKDVDAYALKENLDKNIAKYKRICSMQAPYPLNYLAFSKDYENLAIIIGLLIEKDILK